MFIYLTTLATGVSLNPAILCVTTSWYKQKYNRKARITHRWCTILRGCCQNLSQDFRNSYTVQKQPPRFVLAYQTDQIGIDAATQRCISSQSAQLICYRLKQYRPCCKVSCVRHHGIYKKKRWSSVSISPQTRIR